MIALADVQRRNGKTMLPSFPLFFSSPPQHAFPTQAAQIHLWALASRSFPRVLLITDELLPEAVLDTKHGPDAPVSIKYFHPQSLLLLFSLIHVSKPSLRTYCAQGNMATGMKRLLFPRRARSLAGEPAKMGSWCRTAMAAIERGPRGSGGMKG